MTERTRTRLVLLAILIVGAALRMRGIADRAAWLDEAFCVRLAQFDWGELVSHAALDNHPPLYFAMLKLWMALCGDSPLALRLFDVALALATTGTVFVLARRIFATRAPRPPLLAVAIAAAWVAVHPTHVVWSAQIRMYALAGFLAALSLLLLLRTLERPASWARWSAWVLVAIALLYTHYYGAFVVVAQGVHASVIAMRSPERRVVATRVVASGIALCVAFAPWLDIVGDQTTRLVGGWWVPALTPSRLFWAWSRIPGLYAEDEFLIPSGLAAVAIGAVAIAVGIVVARAAVDRDRNMRLVAWCTLFPLIGGVAMSLATGKNVLLARYLIVAEVVLPIVVVGMVYTWAGRRLAPLLLAPIAVAVMASLAREVATLEPRPDTPAAAAWIAQRRQPDDVIVVHQYYYLWFRIQALDPDPQLHVYTPDGRPIQILGGALVDADDRAFSTASLRHTHGRVFIVDSASQRAYVPKSYRRIEHAQFETAMPSEVHFWIDVTLYDAP